MAQKTKKEIMDWIHDNPNYHTRRLEDAGIEIQIDIRDILNKMNTNLDMINTTLYQRKY